MVRPKRNVQIMDLQSAIKETAWKQIAEYGTSSLSLRAIARDLGITAPAIYNYFPRRDDLVTALIIDAYTSFGDSQIEARDALPLEDINGRFIAIGVAYRQWALLYPQRYQLIFGTPIPGYLPPLEQVFPSGARSMSALVSVVEALRVKGKLNVENFPQITPGFEAGIEAWKKFGGEVEVLSISVSILIWSYVHGLVSLEISAGLQSFGLNGDELYMFALRQMSQQFITD